MPSDSFGVACYRQTYTCARVDVLGTGSAMVSLDGGKDSGMVLQLPPGEPLPVVGMSYAVEIKPLAERR